MNQVAMTIKSLKSLFLDLSASLKHCLRKYLTAAGNSKENAIDLTGDIEKYTRILRVLFDTRANSIFEYACALLRVCGLEDAGWDPLLESKGVFQDVMSLSKLNLRKGRFFDEEKTKVRLMLWGYAHLIEMDAPYNVIANLVRIRNQGRYSWDPFWDIREKKKNKQRKNREVVDLIRGPVPVFPGEKIGRIQSLSSKANIPDVGLTFDDFFYPILRNSIDHSDYILYNNEFRIHKGRIKDPATGIYTQVIHYDTLFEIIRKTYAFYWSFFSLEENARRGFKDLRGCVFPFDKSLKGLLEFKIKEDGSLIGFYIHWPNNHSSHFVRNEGGCNCCNIRIDSDLTVNFFVGEYFNPHSSFSRLVPPNKQPVYKNSIYNGKPLKWSNAYYRV